VSGQRSGSLGLPRLHLTRIDSTNTRARELAARGAPHGTLVTAREQTAGRGRQGRTWTAPPGRALLCSLVIRDPSRLLSLAAGVGVAELVGPEASVKWPNDVLVGGRKVAGILVEGRPQERWAVLGIGVNVALRQQDFPPELAQHAGTLGLAPDALEPTLERLLRSLERWLAAPPSAVLEAVRARDALRNHSVQWTGGEGRAAGIDAEGRLLVDTSSGRVALDAGEVHLAVEWLDDACDVHLAVE
jgi:BirA family biotin operon repressor/biotin-[acetyl-CoA-carboxylase] ligase